MTIRRIIAAVAVAGTLAVLPFGVIASNTQNAGFTVTGGQGSWPLKG